jgi:hypothetical protein
MVDDLFYTWHTIFYRTELYTSTHYMKFEGKERRQSLEPCGHCYYCKALTGEAITLPLPAVDLD